MASNDYKMPIYLQLREIIRNKIEDGEYMPGTAIPSENSLAQTFGINRITIRNAVDALVHEGLLRRVQGKGVFVVGKKSELSIEEHGGFVGDSFTKDSRLTIKELQKTTREAGNLYANLFDLPNVEDEIYYIRQMHYINSVETSIEEFLNLANNGENKMRAGTSVEKDILARTLLLNIEIDNKKEPVFLWNEPFKTLLESLSVNLGAPD